jgi:hypothetical protein
VLLLKIFETEAGHMEFKKRPREKVGLVHGGFCRAVKA